MLPSAPRHAAGAWHPRSTRLPRRPWLEPPFAQRGLGGEPRRDASREDGVGRRYSYGTRRTADPQRRPPQRRAFDRVGGGRYPCFSMATTITSECINCGACEPECPNTAIYQGGVEWQAPDGAMHPALSNDIFYIVPEKCTECVGFHDHEACAAVCPVDCCVPDPKIPETHEVLLARARTPHPGDSIPDDAPSRFKKADAAPAAEAPSAAAPAAAAAAPGAAPAAMVVQAVAAPRPVRRPGTGKVERPVAAVRTPPPMFAGELSG